MASVVLIDHCRLTSCPRVSIFPVRRLLRFRPRSRRRCRHSANSPSRSAKYHLDIVVWNLRLCSIPFWIFFVLISQKFRDYYFNLFTIITVIYFIYYYLTNCVTIIFSYCLAIILVTVLLSF